MNAPWRHWSPRHRLLAAAAAGFALLFLGLGVDWRFRDWPTRGHLTDETKRLKGFHRELTTLEKDARARQRRTAELRRLAEPLWRKQDKNAAVEVQNGLEQAARRSGVTLQNVGAARTGRISDNLSSVDLSLRVAGSMRDVAKFLAELERSQPAFTWASCTVRPDNPREPQGVTVDGRLQAILLSPEAVPFLADPADRKGGTP